MIQIPPHLFSQYRTYCADNGVNDNEFADHLKWLRYFLDFCEKYRITGDDAERTDLFLDKLRQKGQSEEKRQQARKAVSCYFDMIRGVVGRQPPIQHAPTEQHHEQRTELPASARSLVSATESFYNVAGYQEKSDSHEWDEVLCKLADEIKVRHYSRKTLKTYALWSRQFQRFLRNKPPAELTTADVKEYLTYLAVKCHVAASTQNQAFNSLLFSFVMP